MLTLAFWQASLTVHHCYVERRITPLDLYLAESGEAQAKAAALDRGRCLTAAAAAAL
jgi:isocitrate dehydrogenase kinase/phosphatase